LNVKFEMLDRTTLVIPAGRLDFGAAAEFQKQIEQAIASKATTSAVVIIDCAALDYVSSAGLRVFLLGARGAARRHRLRTVRAAARGTRDIRTERLQPHHHGAPGSAERPCAHAAGTRVNEWRRSVVSDPAQLPVLTQFLQKFWSAASLPPAQAMSFELALEEIFMNVVMHGSPAGTVPRVEVSLALAEAHLTMTVEDDGPQFDPLSLSAPDVTASIEERRVGGNGVFLVRQIMDAVAYQHVRGRNQLTMTKHIAR